MAPEPSRRSFLTALAGGVVAVGLSACTSWGRRNDKPSDDALAAMARMDEELARLPGVRSVTTSFFTRAMQEHVIHSWVELHRDVPRADLIAFGTGAHSVVVANQVDPYLTRVTADGTIDSKALRWPIAPSNDPVHFPAAVDGTLGEFTRGASGVWIEPPLRDMTGQRLYSSWDHLDEQAMLAAIPAGIVQLERRLDSDVLGGYTWVNVVLHEGQPAVRLPYEQALADLTPVLQSSTTTLGPGFRRWSLQVKGQQVDSPALISAMTAFLRALRADGGRWDEIEMQYPWHVLLSIEGDVRVARWVDGNSDRAAAEPVVSDVVAAANAP